MLSVGGGACGVCVWVCGCVGGCKVHVFLMCSCWICGLFTLYVSHVVLVCSCYICSCCIFLACSCCFSVYVVRMGFVRVVFVAYLFCS